MFYVGATKQTKRIPALMKLKHFNRYVNVLVFVLCCYRYKDDQNRVHILVLSLQVKYFKLIKHNWSSGNHLFIYYEISSIGF